MLIRGTACRKLGQEVSSRSDEKIKVGCKNVVGLLRDEDVAGQGVQSGCGMGFASGQFKKVRMEWCKGLRLIRPGRCLPGSRPIHAGHRW